MKLPVRRPVLFSCCPRSLCPIALPALSPWGLVWSRPTRFIVLCALPAAAHVARLRSDTAPMTRRDGCLFSAH